MYKLRTQVFYSQIPSLVEAKFTSRSAVTDIPTVPSVSPIKRTNHIDLRVCKNINQSEPEGQILTLASAWKWGCHPLCQRLWKFRSEFRWKGPFRFLLTGIFGITSGGGPLISVGIFWPKLAVPFLTNRFFALISEFGKGIKKNGTIHSYRSARFNRKMSFHFPRVFLLISDRSI